MQRRGTHSCYGSWNWQERRRKKPVWRFNIDVMETNLVLHLSYQQVLQIH